MSNSCKNLFHSKMFLHKVLKLHCYYAIKIFVSTNQNSPCKLKLFPQRWHYSPPGLQSCCYNSSWLQGILYDAKRFKATILIVYYEKITLEGIPRVQLNPIKIPFTSYFLTLEVHRRAQSVIFVDIILDVSLTVSLKWWIYTGAEILDTSDLILLDHSSGFWRRGYRGPPHSW